MTHDEALEALELAALDPAGLDRLMAGDTAMAGAVAGHLAGCSSCALELERLRGQVPLLRDVIATSPPADLRARTLDLVRAQGVARGGPVLRALPADAVPADAVPADMLAPVDVLAPDAAPVDVLAPVAALAAAASPLSSGAPSSIVPIRRSLTRSLPWVAGVAAAVVISIVATSALVGARIDEQLAARDAAIGQLSSVTAATLAISAEPDVERVVLAATDGSATAGTLLFSPSTTELVVVATDLAPPPVGSEYRCWVLRDGERQAVGKMFFGGTLAYWIGDVAALQDLTEGATFGVSLVQVGGPSVETDPVIAGDL